MYGCHKSTRLVGTTIYRHHSQPQTSHPKPLSKACRLTLIYDIRLRGFLKVGDIDEKKKELCRECEGV